MSNSPISSPEGVSAVLNLPKVSQKSDALACSNYPLEKPLGVLNETATSSESISQKSLEDGNLCISEQSHSPRSIKSDLSEQSQVQSSSLVNFSSMSNELKNSEEFLFVKFARSVFHPFDPLPETCSVKETALETSKDVSAIYSISRSTENSSYYSLNGVPFSADNSAVACSEEPCSSEMSSLFEFRHSSGTQTKESQSKPSQL